MERQVHLVRLSEIDMECGSSRDRHHAGAGRAGEKLFCFSTLRDECASGERLK